MHSRDELYQLVWSEPMTKVAKRFEVSSSYLARICSSLNVPRPGVVTGPNSQWAKRYRNCFCPHCNLAIQNIGA